jgi:nicotinamide-nucleotide amidase
MPKATQALSEKVYERMANAGLRVAVAESLTGGLLSDAFVSVPGASGVFSGGVIVYDTALKHSVLGIDAELLDRTGPVDSEVAMHMAREVRRLCAVPRGANEAAVPADIGIATTGVAGPDPDPQTGQPVGTVWLGISSALGERSVRLELDGERAQIRSATVAEALREFAAELQQIAHATLQS